MHAGKRAVMVKDEAVDGALPHRKIFSMLENLAPFGREFIAVGLRAGAPHSGAFRAVEHAELNRRQIGDDTHHAAEGVDFADNLALGDTANSRVAAHLRDLVHIHRHQQSACAESGSGMGSLATGMAGAYYDNIKVKSHRIITYLVRKAWRGLRLPPAP